MNILVFGVAGSGKSTYAKYIANKLNVLYIYTGDLFRSLKEEKSTRGEKIRDLMRKGILIPDDIALPAFKQYLAKFDLSRGLVLDGFPRTLSQAGSLGVNLDLIIHMTLPPQLIIDRLVARGRYDDKPDSIKKRVLIYEEKTKSILNYYEEKGVKIVTLDNSPPIDQVRKSIDGLLENQ